MKKRTWFYLLPGIVLAALAVWWGLPHGAPTSESPYGPVVARPSERAGSPTASPLMSSHPSTRLDTPSGRNVDGRVHSEIEELRAAVSADSNDVASMFRLARLSQDSHRLTDAVTLYRRVVVLQPDNRDAWLDLSRCYGMLGSWEQALDAIEAMLVRYPHDFTALYNKGAVLANLGRLDEARTVWEKVAQQEEDSRARSLAVSSLARLGEG